MIYIFQALFCESKNIIEKYNLCKDTEITKYQVFKNNDDGICLTVTGSGMCEAAIAVSYICARFDVSEKDFIINAGICASLCKNGTFLCNKITDYTTKRTYYPDMLYKTGYPEAHLMTVPVVADSKLLDNISDDLADMEAAAVYQAAIHFVQPHHMFFLKTVSDNGQINDISKEYITGLMKKEENRFFELIETIRYFLQNNSENEADLIENSEEFKTLCRDLHCSETMKNDLLKLITYLELSGSGYRDTIDRLYKNAILPCNNKNEGKACLDELRRELL